MATNIELDEALMRKAMRMSGARTKREAVHEALAEYVARREQSKILSLFGTVDYDPGYDYKAQRKVR
jgi:Arc/MetJ family transcription regulator